VTQCVFVSLYIIFGAWFVIQQNEIVYLILIFQIWWIPCLIAHLEKKLFGIPDLLIAFESPIDTKIMDIFGFGRGPPRWAWQPLKNLRFFKKSWRYPTLKDHILWSGWPIWARICLLERPYSLLPGKNMKFGIYRFLPILDQDQYSIAYNFLWQPRTEVGIWRL
jgi:hypothetical protein